tara:strand:+ start:922 stop:1863 length:942 start_codon:yes stop_codon:yes gene_type:complete
MLGTTYYHQTIRKYVAVFGTLFNDINIQRKNSAGVILEQIKVPVAYSSRDAMLLKVRNSQATGQSITLPRIGFVMDAITYDGTRKLNTMGQVYAANTATTNSTLLKQFNPVPYNFDFTLSAMVDNSEDGAQIFEQIVPFFTPEFNVTVSLIPSMNISPDINIILTGVTVSDTYEGDFTARREILWDLTFTMKGWIYPDVKSGSVTKKVIVNLRMPGEGAVQPPEYILLEDSTSFTSNYLLLDADAGSPDATGDMKVLSEWSSESGGAGIKTRYTVTPGAGDVSANDDFGYTETTEYFNDNVDTNLSTGLDVQL